MRISILSLLVVFISFGLGIAIGFALSDLREAPTTALNAEFARFVDRFCSAPLDDRLKLADLMDSHLQRMKRVLSDDLQHFNKLQTHEAQQIAACLAALSPEGPVCTMLARHLSC